MLTSKFSNGPAADAPRKEPPNLTARQRGKQVFSGAAVAAAMRGAPPEKAAAAPAHRPRAKDSNFANPSEFLSGPQKPGKVTHGVRRYSSQDVDHVAYMLTDEFFASHSAAPKKVNRGPKNGITNNCTVVAEERPFVPGHHIVKPQGPMDAPYHEDADPKPARDAPKAAGVRRFPNAQQTGRIFLAPGERPQQSATAEQAPKATNGYGGRGNRANVSVNVINLAQYSPKQLNERPVAHRPQGPRQFIPQDMPPAPRPTIRRVNTAAREEHDVLCTGRTGKPEKPQPTGRAAGSCRPPHETNFLFSGPAPKPEAKKSAGTGNNLLRYYDPNVDSAKDFAAPAAKRKHDSNRQSNEVCQLKGTGKGHGTFSKVHQSSHNNIFGG